MSLVRQAQSPAPTPTPAPKPVAEPIPELSTMELDIDAILAAERETASEFRNFH